MNARNDLRCGMIGLVFCRRNVVVAALVGFIVCGGHCVHSAQAALLFMEWADTPGVDSKTLSIGQTATINIRLDLIAGESWGSADVPLGVGTWIAPDDIPNFEITGFQADGFIGPSHSYDRSGLPSLPMSPEDYRLTTTYDGVAPIDGPVSIILDQLTIEALSVGHDDIVFSESIPFEGPLILDMSLHGADGVEWTYGIGSQQSVTPEVWTDGVGEPGMFPTNPTRPSRLPLPLELIIVPEPSGLLILATGSILLIRRM